jgi:hypothetical protein
VAFGLNIDSINDTSNRFAEYIKTSLAGVDKCIKNPFFKHNPLNWLYIYRYRRIIRELRKIGRDQINLRIEAIKNNEYVPNDILTTILFNSSLLFVSHINLNFDS